MEYPDLIVSMTTWPPRIKPAIIAVMSLIKSRSASKYKNHIFIKLVISKDEYKDLNALPVMYRRLHQQKLIEIIFDEGNLKAHKKIVPIAEKYGNQPILVVDDDFSYDRNFLNIFYEDMLKYPNEVLCGRTRFRIIPENGELISQRIETIHNDIAHEIPYEELSNEKFLSGVNGTLFPPNTFTDKRFFDRDLIKKVCEQSDEDWCWLFCILKDMPMRRTGHERRDPKNLQLRSALSRLYGQNYYAKYYYPNFIEYFPEVYDILVKRIERYKNKQ